MRLLCTTVYEGRTRQKQHQVDSSKLAFKIPRLRVCNAYVIELRVHARNLSLRPSRPRSSILSRVDNHATVGCTLYHKEFASFGSFQAAHCTIRDSPALGSF